MFLWQSAGVCMRAVASINRCVHAIAGIVMIMMVTCNCIAISYMPFHRKKLFKDNLLDFQKLIMQ